VVKNKLCLADIEAKIKGVEYRVFGGRLTVAVVTMANGFQVVGESSCVDVANFDAGLGEKYAYEDAVEQLWMLEGYLLRERLYQEGLV